MLTWLITLCEEIYCELLIMRSTSIFYAMGRKIGFFGFLQKMTIENSPIIHHFIQRKSTKELWGFFYSFHLWKKNTIAKNFLNQNFSIENNNSLIYLFNRPYRWSFSLFISYVCNGYIFTLMSWKRPKTNFSNRLENICFFWYIRKNDHIYYIKAID